MYKLLASSRLLLESQTKLSDTATRAHADELMEFFITDSTRRVRTSALKSLELILAKDTLTDLLLVSDPRGRAACLLGQSKRGVLVTECVALSNHTSFRERILLYFIRLVGACWSPDLTSGAVESSHYDGFSDDVEDEESRQLATFLSFAPTIFSDKFLSTAPSTPPIFTPPVQSAGLSDKTAAREASGQPPRATAPPAMRPSGPPRRPRQNLPPPPPKSLQPSSRPSGWKASRAGRWRKRRRPPGGERRGGGAASFYCRCLQ